MSVLKNLFSGIRRHECGEKELGLYVSKAFAFAKEVILLEFRLRCDFNDCEKS